MNEPRDPPDYALPDDTGARLLETPSPDFYVDLDPRRQDHDERPPAFTDDAIAQIFASRHCDRLRYVAALNRWLMWDGKVWNADETLNARNLVRMVCREVAAGCNDPKVGKTIASAKTVAAVERLAQSDRRLAATVEQWDADPWLLNTPEGVIDLRNATRRQQRPTDYLTKITAVAPDQDCATPLWDSFLERATDGKGDLAGFIQRSLGYALTGSTQEHALFFWFGRGANGKSVALNTVAGILGPYHRTAPIETFTASNNDRHPTDLAGLRGARLVTAIETEDGRRWAESRIKSLTGGDKIAARFMRQDFFEFTPQFKLIIAGNHKPALRNVDEAIKRRMNIVPFTVTIPVDERDDTLSERLRAEWPGILDALIEGCIEWQLRGLAPPQIVTDATAEYLEGEDAIAAWIDDAGDRDPNGWETSATLFASWSAWAARSGEFVGNQKRFVQQLESRGLTYERRATARGYRGLRLHDRSYG